MTPHELDRFDSNVGKGGCTVFAAMVWERQRRDMMGLPWCATFIHAVMDRPDILGKAHPGTRVLARRMRRRGLWRGHGYVPRSGDLIFCRNAPGERIQHCGIVEGADGRTVTSIDGNTHDPEGFIPWEEGGYVDRVTRPLDDWHIVGYAATGNKLSVINL